MSGMTEAERWIYLDGPEPEPLRSILDSVRESDVYVRSVRVEPEERDALPPPPPAPEPAPAAAPIQAGAQARPGNPLAATADMDLSRLMRPVLPYVPDSPGRVKAPRTLNSEVMRDPRLKETAKLGEDLMSAVVPLTPFLGNTVGQGVVPFPRMDVEKYAWLRVELPEVAAGMPREVLLDRYHVMNEASLRALVAHWTTRLDRDAEERARYDALLATITHHVYEVRPRGQIGGTHSSTQFRSLREKF